MLYKGDINKFKIVYHSQLETNKIYSKDVIFSSPPPYIFLKLDKLHKHTGTVQFVTVAP